MVQFDIAGMTAAAYVPATESGTSLAADLANFAQAVKSKNSGIVRPQYNSNAPPAGLEWLDNSGSPWAIKIFDGTNDVIIGWIDNTNHQWIPAPTGGVVAIAAAATINLAPTNALPFYVSVTGISGAPITSFGTAPAGVTKRIVWASTQTQPVTYNATSMILPGGASITPQAGDSWEVLNISVAGTPSANWKVVGISTTAAPSSVIGGAFQTSGVISPTALTADANNYNPSGLANASIIRLTSTGAGHGTPLAWFISGLQGGAQGRRVTFVNANAPGGLCFTFQPKNVASTDVFQFGDTLDNPLPPGGTVTFEYDTGATNTTGATGAWISIGATATASPAPPNFRNLVVKNGATPNSQMLITADAVVVADATGLFSRSLTGISVTADLAVSGAGGMDTGSRPMGTVTWLYLYVIYAPVSGTIAALISLSATAPALPTGYTMFSRVSSVVTNAAATGIFNQIWQNGRVVHYVPTSTSGQIPTTVPNVTVGLNSGNGGMPTTVTLHGLSLFSFVSPTASKALVIITNKFNAGSANANVVIAPTASAVLNQATWGPEGGAGNVFPVFIASAAGPGSVLCSLDLEGTLTVGYAADAAGGGFSVWGYEDNL